MINNKLPAPHDTTFARPTGKAIKRSIDLVYIAKKRPEKLRDQVTRRTVLNTLLRAGKPESNSAARDMIRLGLLPEDGQSLEAAKHYAVEAGNRELVEYLDGIEKRLEEAYATVKKTENFTPAELEGLRKLEKNRFTSQEASKNGLWKARDQNKALRQALRAWKKQQALMPPAVSMLLYPLNDAEALRAAQKIRTAGQKYLQNLPPDTQAQAEKKIAELLERDAVPAHGDDSLLTVGEHVGDLTPSEKTMTELHADWRDVPRHMARIDQTDADIFRDLSTDSLAEIEDPFLAEDSQEHQERHAQWHQQMLCRSQEIRGYFKSKLGGTETSDVLNGAIQVKPSFLAPRKLIVCRHFSVAFIKICETGDKAAKRAFFEAARQKESLQKYIDKNLIKFFSETAVTKHSRENEHLSLNKEYMGELLRSMIISRMMHDQLKSTAISFITMNTSWSSGHMTACEIKIKPDPQCGTHVCRMIFFDPNTTKNYLVMKIKLDDIAAWKALSYGKAFPFDTLQDSDYLEIGIPKTLKINTHTPQHPAHERFNGNTLLLSPNNIFTALYQSTGNAARMKQISDYAKIIAGTITAEEKLSKYMQLRNTHSLTAFGIRRNYLEYEQLKKRQPEVYAEFKRLKAIFKPTREEMRELRRRKT